MNEFQHDNSNDISLKMNNISQKDALEFNYQENAKEYSIKANDELTNQLSKRRSAMPDNDPLQFSTEKINRNFNNHASLDKSNNLENQACNIQIEILPSKFTKQRNSNTNSRDHINSLSAHYGEKSLRQKIESRMVN